MLTVKQRESILGLYSGIAVIQDSSQSFRLSSILTDEVFGSHTVTTAAQGGGGVGASLPLVTGPQYLTLAMVQAANPGATIVELNAVTNGGPGTNDLSDIIKQYGTANRVYFIHAGTYRMKGNIGCAAGVKIYGECLDAADRTKQVVITGMETLTGWTDNGVNSNGLHVWYCTPPNDRNTGLPWTASNARIKSGEQLGSTAMSTPWTIAARDKTVDGFGEQEDMYFDRLTSNGFVGKLRTLPNNVPELGGSNETASQVPSRMLANEWFWDYAANRIYVASDPTGHVVEITTRSGYQGKAFNLDNNHRWDNGLLQNVVVEGFAEGQGICAIDLEPCLNTTVKNVRAQYNRGGIRIGQGGTIDACYIAWNGQNGIKGSRPGGTSWDASNITVKNSEFAFNCWMHIGGGFEGGDGKFWNADNVLCQNNYSHDCFGAAFWADYCRTNIIYTYNTFINSYMAPTMEMSQSGEFSHNLVTHCSWRGGTATWSYSGYPDLWGGFFVYNGAGIKVHHNQFDDNFGTLGLQLRERGWSGQFTDPERPNMNWMSHNQSSGGDARNDTLGFVCLTNCTMARTTAWAGTGKVFITANNKAPQTGSIAFTATADGDMSFGTTRSAPNKQTTTRLMPSTGTSFAVTVRASGNARQARIRVDACDYAGNILNTFTSAYTATSTSADTTLTVAGTTDANAVWGHISVDVQSCVAGDIMMADKWYTGLTTFVWPIENGRQAGDVYHTWTVDGAQCIMNADMGYGVKGFVLGSGETQGGIYDIEIHDNTFINTIGSPGYTGYIGINNSDWLHRTWNNPGGWYNGAFTSAGKPIWYNNTYKHSADPWYANSDTTFTNGHSRFVAQFPTGNPNDNSEWVGGTSSRWVSFNYWVNTLGQDAGSTLVA